MEINGKLVEMYTSKFSQDDYYKKTMERLIKDCRPKLPKGTKINVILSQTTDSIYGEFIFPRITKPFEFSLRNHHSRDLSHKVYKFYVYQYSTPTDLSRDLLRTSLIYYNNRIKGKKVDLTSDKIIKLNNHIPTFGFKSEEQKRIKNFFSQKGYSPDYTGRDITLAELKIDNLEEISKEYCNELKELNGKYNKLTRQALDSTSRFVTKEELDNSNALAKVYIHNKGLKITEMKCFKKIGEPILFKQTVENETIEVLPEPVIKGRVVWSFNQAILPENEIYVNDLVKRIIGNNGKFWNNEIWVNFKDLSDSEKAYYIVSNYFKQGRNKSKEKRKKLGKRYKKSEINIDEYKELYLSALYQIIDINDKLFNDLPEYFKDKEDLFVNALIKHFNNLNQDDKQDDRTLNVTLFDKISRRNLQVPICLQLKRYFNNMGYPFEIDFLNEKDIYNEYD